MKVKKVLILVLITCIFCVLFKEFLLFKNINDNELKLKNNILSINSLTDEKIEFNTLADFDWDSVYFFDPYISKERIFDIIGTKYWGIETQTSEAMMQIIFIKNNKVVCYCASYGFSNGYYIDGNVKDEYCKFDKNDNVYALYDYDMSQSGYTYIKCITED